MAFVNEFVPEEDKERFSDTTIWHRPSTKNEPIIPRKWVIDRERDIFVVGLGGGIKRPYEMRLCFKGKVIKYQASARSTLIESIESNLYLSEWYIFDLKIPAMLEKQQQEIMKLIEEANEAIGNSIFDASKIKAVKTHFAHPSDLIPNWQHY